MGERRAFRRLPADTEVKIRLASGGPAAEGRSKNLSGGGILLSSRRRFEPGTLLDIEVITQTHRKFSHVFPPLVARVRVVRVEGDSPPYNIAAEFVDVRR